MGSLPAEELLILHTRQWLIASEGDTGPDSILSEPLDPDFTTLSTNVNPSNPLSILIVAILW